MRVQHNIMAMSAYRNYTNNTSAMQKNLEKLSSGFKINRAGDDAAGLAISEKMRAQITGLQTAQKNAKDGISLVQTAEGALTEVHDMLNRMVELATQSANDTYSNETDREQLQKEVVKLREEIDRIAQSANFNGITLLDGTWDGEAKTIAAAAATVVNVSSVEDGVQGGGAGQAGVYELDLDDLEIAYQNTSLAAGQTEQVEVTLSVTVNGTEYKFTGTMSGATDSESVLKGSDFTWSSASAATTFTVGGVTYAITIADGKVVLTGQAAPTSTDDMPAGIQVGISNATGTSISIEITGGHDLGFHPTEEALIAGSKHYGYGEFTLDKSHITDGAKLTIGDKTYVFAVGDGEKNTTKAEGDDEVLIDLTKYKADDENLTYYAAMALAKEDNGLFDISVNGDLASGADSYTIQLREKAYDEDPVVDYEKDFDLSSSGDWDAGIEGGDYEGRGVVMWQAGDTKQEENEEKALTLQIGDTAAEYNQMKVYIGSIKTEDLGIDEIDISDRAKAADAIDIIKKAINQVSDIRGTLGATQNRLDHTINNLSVMTENIQDAESTIRDTDVAEEMMAYTKNNILIQASQAMLAQANQIPQGVLQLLQ